MVEETASSATEPQQWGMLGTVAWGATIAAVFLTLQAVVMVAFVSQGRTTLTERELQDLIISAQAHGVAFSIATLITAIVCVSLLLGIVKLKRRSRVAHYLALRPVPFKTLAIWCGGLALFIALSDALTLLLGRPLVPEFMTSVYTSAPRVWLVWLAVVVAAPLFEESFVRGFLFKGCASLGPTWAILITAALWAAVHAQYDLYEMGTVFCLGLLLGAARAKTESLFPSLIMHSMANILATIETALVVANGAA